MWRDVGQSGDLALAALCFLLGALILANYDAGDDAGDEDGGGLEHSMVHVSIRPSCVRLCRTEHVCTIVLCCALLCPRTMYTHTARYDMRTTVVGWGGGDTPDWHAGKGGHIIG